MNRIATRRLAPWLTLMVLVLGTCTAAAMGQRVLSALSQSTCELGWSSPVGGAPGMNGAVAAMIVFDDGSGPALYVGGLFSMAGEVPVNYIARWDGQSWWPLGSGMNERVHALVVFDDGSGPALYAGGVFTSAGGVEANHIAKWDGTSWSPLGEGFDHTVTPQVYSLFVHDFGSGPLLIAGGRFTSAGGVEANHIAAWDGATWTSLGNGVNHHGVRDLAIFDDGEGPALYAGGWFTMAGKVEVNNIAKWDGETWSPLANGTNDIVHVLAVYDDGSGPSLYAGGRFTVAGSVNAPHLARWDGEIWSSVAEGADASIFMLTVINDGPEEWLYIGGLFSTIGGIKANGIVKWNGTDFETFGEGLNGLGRTVCKYDAGDEDVIYVGGSFVQAGGQPAYYVATWDGEEWNRVGTAEGLGAVKPVLSIATFDSGTGDELYASGPGQTTIGGLEGDNALVRWNGETWSIVSDEWSGTAIAMEVLDLGNGPALYLGGAFGVFLDGDPYFGRVAKWDGRSFTPLGQGLNHQVNDFAVYDDGNGEALYAVGFFTQTGDGVSANRIARWDGKSWHPLGSGLNGSAWVMAVFDDGSGPALYAAGIFNTAGGVSAINVARWDGTAWTAVGDGLNDLVRDLKVFDDGTGPALYAAGQFTASGSEPMNYIAKWNGTHWSPVGGGTNDMVWSLYVDENVDASALLASGNFTMAGGQPARRIAKWDGAQWSTFGSGIDGVNHINGWHGVIDMATFDDGDGPALYLSGNFGVAGCAPAQNLARLRYGDEPGVIGDINRDCMVSGKDLLILLNSWGTCPESDSPWWTIQCPADLSGDGVVDGQDLLILLANWMSSGKDRDEE